MTNVESHKQMEADFQNTRITIPGGNTTVTNKKLNCLLFYRDLRKIYFTHKLGLEKFITIWHDKK